jgi:hypothetical protein
MFKTGMQELNLSSSIPVMTYIEFVDKNSQNFDYIFCDEVQDLPARVLYAMNNRARKVIVAGDSNQSIYDTDPRWQEASCKSKSSWRHYQRKSIFIEYDTSFNTKYHQCCSKDFAINEYLGSKKRFDKARCKHSLMRSIKRTRRSKIHLSRST